jgi:hypothetical protein
LVFDLRDPASSIEIRSCMSTTPVRTGAISLLPLVLLAGGCGLLSDPPPPPDAPTQLIAEPASTESIDLTWTTMAEPDEFRLERAHADTAFTEIAVVDGSGRSYLDTGLEADQRYRYRLRACGEGGCSDAVTGEAATYAPLTVVTTSLPPGFMGVPYAEAVNAAGGDGDYHWSVLSGIFPPGLVLDDTSGIITGTPDASGRYTFTLEVRDAGGRTASEGYTVTILSAPPAVSIRNFGLPPVVEGGAYRVELVGSGGDGETYSWTVVSGSLPPGVQLTSGGAFQGTATAAGSYAMTIQVSSAGQSSTKAFTIRVVPDDPGAFTITTFPVVPIPASIQPHLDSAKTRWERAIAGDLTTVSVPAGLLGASSCGGFGDEVNGTTVDDVLMIINIAPIDGPGQVLGQAGPCAIRGDASLDASLPFVGVLTLDAEDLTPIAGESTVTDIVFHEMGHVLGFGALWEIFELVQGAGTGDPRYTGGNAVTEWQALGGAGSVPVANQGGDGTADVHWRESVFDREIMTGFAESVGVDQPFSRVSLASMMDLGYDVDMSAVDSYQLLSALRSDVAAAGGLGYDILLDSPIVVLEADGGRSVIRP